MWSANSGWISGHWISGTTFCSITRSASAGKRTIRADPPNRRRHVRFCWRPSSASFRPSITTAGTRRTSDSLRNWKRCQPIRKGGKSCVSSCPPRRRVRRNPRENPRRLLTAKTFWCSMALSSLATGCSSTRWTDTKACSTWRNGWRRRFLDCSHLPCLPLLLRLCQLMRRRPARSPPSLTSQRPTMFPSRRSAH